MAVAMRKSSTRSVFTRAIVTPARDEEENISPLIIGVEDQPGLHDMAVQMGGPLLLVIVDDSDHARGLEASNGVRTLLCGGDCPHLTIEHIIRPQGQRPGRLSGAVKHGIEYARAQAGDCADELQIVVMDADLQHNPQYVPQLFKELEAADLAVTTRYHKDGSNEGLSDGWRVVASRGSTLLAKGLFPRLLRGVSDPMTGFYGFRSSAIDLDRLRPQGFKILVEMLLSHSKLSRTEVPFVFGSRINGESKGSLREGLTFLGQLVRHRVGAVGQMLNFAIGGAGAALAGVWLLHVLVESFGLNKTVAYSIMLPVTVVLNFAYNRWVTFRRKPRGPLLAQLGQFFVSRTATIVGSFVMFWALSSVGVHYQLANLVALNIGMAVNYWSSCKIFSGRVASILTRNGGNS